MVVLRPPHRDALNVLPYRALLRTESWEQRKRMVMDLYESGHPEASAVLHQALQDPDERIRLLAALALERLSEKSEKAIQRERRRVDAEPELSEARLELARLLYDRAASAGHSLETQRSTYSEAAWHVAAAIDHLKEPLLTSARLQLGRIYARLGRGRDGCTVLGLVPPTAPDYANARFLIAEMQLTLGNLDGCRSEMAAISALPHRDEMNNAVNYWTGRP